uniref:hypothetical protein n=1 Tax=Ningiella ruwaisensis TaxID=2364274 RepID=UPI00109F56F7|nr:hypothetical protein [Ningiella ruwaisensis]
MTRLIYFSAVLFLSLFVFVEVATAKLIRGGGRGTISLQTEVPYYFVENDRVLQIEGSVNGRDFDTFTAMSEAAFLDRNAGFGISTRTIGGGSSGISAMPSFSGKPGSTKANDCNGSYTPDDVREIEDEIEFLINTGGSADNISAAEGRLSALRTGTPCEWQLTQGDDFTAFGTFSMFFDNPLINTTIEWTISGNGIEKTLTGSINTDPDRVTEDGAIGVGEVVLDALWEDLDLLPGIYDISVSAMISSDAGMFFREQINTSSESFIDPIDLQYLSGFNPEYDAWVARKEAAEKAGLPFDEPEPQQELDGYVMADDFSEYIAPSSSLFFNSTSFLLGDNPPEILRVLARPVEASAPASSALLVLLGALVYFRHKKAI